MSVLILQHGELGPPALLGEWCAARGLDATVHRPGAPLPALNGQAFVASLGSANNPATDLPEVAAERAYLAEAVSKDIPVLGLCFGGQMLSAVFGGEIERSPQPELGWHEIETADPGLVPAGPWLQWHYDRFTLPPGAEQVASSPNGVQAFTHGRHLGVQFHPESTIEIVSGWARKDAEKLRTLGIEDGEARVQRGRHHAAAAVTAAFDLFDAFWQRART